MNDPNKTDSNLPVPRSQTILAILWVGIALIALVPVTLYLDGAFPIFTLVTLLIPLIVLLRSRDAGKVGFRLLDLNNFIQFTLINLAASLALMLVFEPWSHTYRSLLEKTVSNPHPDTTFGWLVRFPGIAGWAGFVIYAGIVTLFAEELFFRGWLLTWLKRKMKSWKAIILQALLFTIPQCLAAFLLPPLQGVFYAVVYSWLAIGLINGWIASRTRSILPGLVSATLLNLTMCIWLMHG